ncbi:MAG TPA: type II toxin-antitoxin system VapC family toxin [Solirubrobacteraceae bacterium]|nr:type II toxin-antitoxin system VapC family toxin [Solirubrobacteraceae bacterium]
MRSLLDTHALLSLLFADGGLSRSAEEAVERPDAELLVSVVSVWEIAIKRSVGKLEAPEGVLERIEEAGAELLSITGRHADAVAHLPFHHRDPFDRLLIAQAKLEGCAVITKDLTFTAYGVPIVW